MMKRSLAVILAFLVGVGMTALAQNAQSPKDAVAIDPTHHHVVLDNARVRAYEVMASRGDKSPMHTHPPVVVVSLGTTRLAMTTPDGKKAILDLHPGQVLWLENVEHSWEVLSGELHVVAMEPKKAT
jgi:hypothetical protein